MSDIIIAGGGNSDIEVSESEGIDIDVKDSSLSDDAIEIVLDQDLIGIKQDCLEAQQACEDSLEEFQNMNVVTGTEGTNATWDGDTLTIPRGDKGDVGDTGEQGIQGIQGEIGLAGENGLTPNYEFSYNGLTGDLEYEFDGYTYETAPSIEEII